MEWKDVAIWLFFGGWSCIGLYVANSISRMGNSVEKLNVNVAVVVQQLSEHDRRISRLEDGDRK